MKLWERVRRLGSRLRGVGRGSAASPAINAAKLNRHYVSEHTEFMARFLAEHPEVAADQAAGRGMYWDKKVDFAAAEKAAEDSVPPEAYAYYRPLTPAASKADDKPDGSVS